MIWSVQTTIKIFIYKFPVQVPTIETCFMSIDKILVARILSKSRSPYIRGELNMKEMMKKYKGNMKDIIMKKYEEDMKKYGGNMKIRTLLIYGPRDLEKFRAHPLISGGGENFQV